MQIEKHLDNAVLIYLFLLICLVIINMVNKACFMDVIYLVTLICAILKYFMITNRIRK